MTRKVKDLRKRLFFRCYRLALRFGFHILPAHYYTAAPNILELEKSLDLWTGPTSFPGMHVDLDEQLEALKRVCLPYRAEYAGNAFYREAVRENYGPGFGYIEAQVLYAMIRYCQPARFIEVGSGISTFCSFRAGEQNHQEGKAPCKITCFEPYPSRPLETLARQSANIDLIAHPVQQGPAELFRTLAKNDILFIDSSHVLKAGSDVHYLVLEVLPRLQPGVLVHFHDIYFPYDYQRDLLHSFIHNNETPFLRAFLAFNHRFSVLFSLSHLHYERKEGLGHIFPEYISQGEWRGLRRKPCGAGTHFPSSLWLRVEN